MYVWIFFLLKVIWLFKVNKKKKKIKKKKNLIYQER